MEQILIWIIGILVTLLAYLIKISIINPISKWPEQVQAIANEQVSTKEVAHSAHKRIDNLEGRVEVLERGK